MAANIRARGFQLLINEVDWSQYCYEATLVLEEIDLGDGDCRTTATFRLDVSEISPLPTYRSNPSQWAKGIPVLYKVRNDSNVLVVPEAPTGYLYILKEPSAPSVGNPIIELECGCALTLKDYDTPDTDASGVTVGTSADRQTIVGNILASAGLTTNLSAMPYPIDYPVPKTGGSLVQLAGEVATAAGHFLYVDSNGDVVNKAIDLAPSTAVLNVTIGEDESDWEPSEDSENPVDKIIVSGVTYDVDNLPYQEDVTSISGTVSSVNPFAPYDNTLIDPITRTTTRIYAYDPATKSRKTEVIEEAIKVIIERTVSNANDPDFYTLFTERTRTDIKYYDGEKLIRETCDTRVVGAQSARFIDTRDSRYLQLLPFEFVDTRYFYAADNTINQITIETKKIKGQITPFYNFLSQFDLVPASKIDSRWTNLGGETWKYTKSESVPYYETATVLTVVNGNLLDRFYELKGQPATTSTKSDGSTNPPATEYLDKNRLTERQIESCVRIETLGSTAFGDRQKSVTVNHAVSEDQLYEYGQLYNAFLWGRRFGWRVGLPISDAVLALTPGDRVDVTDGDTIYRLLVDGLTYSFDSIESFAYFTGIEVGTAPVGDPTNTSIFSQVIVGVSFADAVVISETFTTELDTGNATFADEVVTGASFTITQITDIEFADEVVIAETFTIELEAGSILFDDNIVINHSFRVN